MLARFPIPHFVTWWVDRPHRCLRCRKLMTDSRPTLWCSAECEDYWAQDSI
jgi:hypothetical protein